MTIVSLVAQLTAISMGLTSSHQSSGGTAALSNNYKNSRFCEQHV